MKALFVFCEGAHDIALVRRLLRRAKDQFNGFDDPVGKYPPPLGEFLIRRIKNQSLEGKKVDQIQQHEPPSLAYVASATASGTLVLLYRLQGEKQYDSVKKYIEDWKTALSSLRFNPQRPVGPPHHTPVVLIESWSIAFIVDADSKGVDGKLQQIRREFTGTLGDLSSLDHGTFRAGASSGDPAVGFLALRAAGSETGTLEDMIEILIRRCGHGSLLELSKKFVEENASNAPEGCELNPKKSLAPGSKPKDPLALKAKMSKAALTCLGQFGDPGANYAVFVEQSKIISDDVMIQEPQCKALVDFLLAGANG